MTMKKIILALLVLTILVLSGCKDGVTGGAIVCNKPYILVGNDCCLDKNDNSICDNDEVEKPVIEQVEPPKEEVVEEPVVEEVISEPEEPEEIVEEIPSNEFLMKVGDSIKFDKKTITLVGLENIPKLKAILNIDGVERDIYETKNLEIINNIEVNIMKYLNLENSVIIKLEKFKLGNNEYMITPRKDIPFKNMKIHLEDVQDEGKILIHILDTDSEDNKVIIKEGETRTLAGLQITNIDGFPRGFKIEEYAIIKIEV